MPLGAIVKQYQLIVNGMHYFSRDALKFRLGDYGEKKQPVTGMYLQNQGMLIPRFNDVRVDGVQIDFKKSTSWGLEAGFKVVDEGTTYEINAGMAQEKLSNGELVLTKFEAPLGEVLTATKNTPGAVAKLDGLGRDARVVVAIFQIVSAKVYNTLTTSGKVDFTYTPSSGPQIVVTIPPVTGSATTTVTYGAGSTLAYMLGDPVYKNKILEKFTLDGYGIG